MDITRESIIKVNDEILTTTIDNELGMMNINKGFYYTLNPIGKHIWDMMGEKLVVKDLIESLSHSYNVDEDVCFNDVQEWLKIMSTNGLVEVKE